MSEIVTEAMVAALWAEETEPLVQMITIEATGLAAPITVSDCPDRLLPGLRQGIVSNGVEYPYMPFRLSWAGASRDQPFGQAKLAISNLDSRIEAAIEEVDDPMITLRLARVASPDVVERSIVGAQIGQSDFTESEVSAVIRPKDFDLEPACATSYTPATTPGQF